MSIVVVGSLSRDLTAVAPRIPKEGETILGSKFVRSFGGKGANQAVMLSMLGSSTNFVGMVGDDSNGNDYIEHFKSIGVATEAISVTPDSPTGIAMISVSSTTGENSIIVVPGANGCLGGREIEMNSSLLQQASAVLLQLEVPLETAATAAAVASSGTNSTKTQIEDTEKSVYRPLIVLNPAPAPEGGIPRSFAGIVDLVTPNETECRILAVAARKSRSEATAGRESTAEDASEGTVKASSVEEDARTVLETTGVGAIVVTLGASGCLVGVRGQLSDADEEIASGGARVSEGTSHAGAEVGLRSESRGIVLQRVELLAPRGKQCSTMIGEAAGGHGHSDGDGGNEWKVVDTTGAGDAFNGALVHALCQGGGGAAGARARAGSLAHLCKAAQAAGYVASTSVGKLGTQDSYPQPSDLPSDLFAS